MISEQTAKEVLQLLKEQRGVTVDEPGPEIRQDSNGWSSGDDGTHWYIFWEEGPYDWSMYFPGGGTDEEYGFTIKDVSDEMPDGVYIECICSWGLAGIYEV